MTLPRGFARRHRSPRRGRRGLAAAALLAVVAAPADGQTTIPELVEIVDISGLSASPDGTRIAFRTERASIAGNSYALEWHVADLAQGEVRRVGGGGAPVYDDPGLLRTEASFWSPDGRFLFFRALLDGGVGIWRAAADGSGMASAVSDDSDVETIEPAGDGTSLVFRLGPTRAEIERAERNEYDSGILVDRTVDLAQPLYRGGSIQGRMATQRLTGPWFRRGGLLADRPRRSRRLDLASLDISDIARPPAAPVSGFAPAAEPVAWNAAGSAAAIAGSGETSTVEVRRGDGEIIACEAPQCRSGRVGVLLWRPGHDELILTVENSDHAQSLHSWVVGDPDVRLVANSEGLLSGSRDPRAPCAITESAAVCVSSAPGSPPRLERIDLAAGARSVLFDPNAALRSNRTLRYERLAWRSPRGDEFTGVLLTSTSNRAPSPLLIHYYRCDGFLRGGVGDELPMAPLASAGFAVVCVNAPAFSGPQEAETTYRVALGGIRSLVGLLQRRGLIDARKVGMAGLSFGSEVTMWTAMNSRLLAAASIASIQLEPAYYWFNAVRGRDHPDVIRQVWGLGPPDATPGRWRSLSPALNTDRIRAPVLMQLPEQEARYVVELHARLTNSATPAELYVFPDEAHIKLQPRHKLAVYQRNLDWFGFWLLDKVDPDPAKAGQYAGWEALRARRLGSSAPGPNPELGRR